MKCLVLNSGVVGLLAALALQKQFARTVSIHLMDAAVVDDCAIIRIGPETLNFIVRNLGIALTDLMQGEQPGIFYLGMQVRPMTGSVATISHYPNRALIGGLPVNYAIDRVRRVGGQEKLENYSLAARMINANAMALPNKKGECPLGDDEIGISISLAHLRAILIARLAAEGVAIERADEQALQMQNNFATQYDFIVSSSVMHDDFQLVQWCQATQWGDAQTLALPCASLELDNFGWTIRSALAAQKSIRTCRIGWSNEAGYVNLQSSWFGCHWGNAAVYLPEHNYWGADFLLDPLQPVLRALQLLTQLFPVRGVGDLAAQYFNERSIALAQSVREFVVAILIEGAVSDGADILSAADITLYQERKNIYLNTGEAKQPAANLLRDGIWAALWHGFSVLPNSVSTLLRPLNLEDVTRQLSDIDKNIADIIPRLPRHHYYISLINGGAA